MWTDPVKADYYPNARYLPTADVSESEGKHFITLAPLEQPTEESNKDLLSWEIENNKYLRNGMKVCIKTMKTTDEGYDWLYSEDNDYLYYDTTCNALEAQWKVVRFEGSGDYITKYDRIILRNDLWKDDLIHRYADGFLISENDFSDQSLTHW